MENKKGDSRRKFLDKGLKIGLVTAIGSIGLTKLATSISAQSQNASGDKMQLMTTDGKLIEVDSSQVEEVVHSNNKEVLYNVREGFPNRKFVMVVDLARCKNAQKCIKSCNSAHYITTHNAWLKIYDMKESKETASYWMPTMCQHCDHPPCVKVCPVDATFKRRDGLVLIDNERCIGCRFCMAACPYSARVFNWSEPNQGKVMLDSNMETEHGSVMDHSAPSTPDYAGNPSIKGTVDKCDFCPHRIKEGKLPHCVTACPNGVYFFGDAYEDSVTNGEETFQLSKLLKDKAGYRIMESLGTEPSVYYLPPVDRMVDFEKGLDIYHELNPENKSH
ncbi:MAG: 4Fe-4S dicluster domain-containing protein [Flavobacteriaceae bacterium]|nr:4Fe-4S dicluster domain-containing protein [Flavobacteriaceae bacterium]